MIDNKTIVLTGASSGIGFEVLKLLAQGKGNRILAVARHVDNIKYFADNVTAWPCDISTQADANAGFPYYEEFNYTDWDRIDAMFRTNTISPIYTYAKYIAHLNGREGILAYTVSAIGEMAMPGYAIYSSSKFALNGFQQAIRMEKPDNLQITCLYPVATDTNFFKVANAVEFEKPFPVQKPSTVAKKMVKGIEEGAERVSPCGLFGLSKVLMGALPPVKTVYLNMEKAKLERFKQKLSQYHNRLHADAAAAVEHGRELGSQIREKNREVVGELEERAEKVRGEIEEKAAKAREEIKDRIHGV